MDEIAYDNPLARRARVLTQLLIFSFALNVGLITTMVYRSLFTTDFRSASEASQLTQRVLSPTSAEIVKELMDATYEEVLQTLQDGTHIQDGFTKRDFALACLVEYHFFDIEKALSGFEVSTRRLSFLHREGGETFYLPVFVGLEDYHYQLIQRFIGTHEWPLSPEGIFYELKEQRENSPNSLVRAFYATGSFTKLYTFIHRFDASLVREQLLLMLLDGNWWEISSFCHTWQGSETITIDHIRELLQKFIMTYRSAYAAAIWVKIDSDYLLRRLDDQELFALIDSIHDQLVSSKRFLKKLLCSVRSDQIRRVAALKLFALEGEDPPDPYNYEEALRRFLPSMLEKGEKTVSVYTPHYINTRKHVVQEGDSLWKLSRKYRISIEALRKENKLETDILRPGRELIIPVIHGD